MQGPNANLSFACITCHVSSGLSGNTRLVFIAGTGQAEANSAVFETFVETVDSGASLLLNKVRGGEGHGGNAIMSSNSEEYRNLETYLSSLTGEGGSQQKQAFFENITFESSAQTLRRASLLFAGRLPSDDEIGLAETNEASLRSVIRSLMTGDGFHQFLIRGANDKLLTDSFLNGAFLEVVDPFSPAYPILANMRVNAYSTGGDAITDFQSWMIAFNYGVARAPLELLAHVVENDLPYTEILTADYTMVNPQSNVVFNSGVGFDSDDPTVFKVGQNSGQIPIDNEFMGEFLVTQGTRVDSHGEYVDYPHAGVLNELAFLNRYPTTDTNRNRARSRWTNYFFLNVDIEKSASRTTDPDALADTNNPTLNNPNCTVCHRLMDPIAGAYQNYGDEGRYRSSYGGLDSLPETYKEGDGTPFVWGDTWYRDMLSPGVVGIDLPAENNANSLQWLAEQISADDRFAQATVYFWWETVMSENLRVAPEDSSDANFEDQLSGFEAQAEIISELSQGFRQGFNGGAAYDLKDLLTELVMSDWFRADGSSVELDESRNTALEGVGDGRLLTPLELEAKTSTLIGFTWGEAPNVWTAENRWTQLGNNYRIYYGGIDAMGITERAKVLNTLMSNVALAQATNVSCPTVVFEFNREAEDRNLFKFVDRFVSPTFQVGDQYTVAATSYATASTHQLSEDLNTGSQRLRLSFDNPYWDSATDSSQVLILHQVTVTGPGGETVLSFNPGDIQSISGADISLNEEGNPTGVVNWINGTDPGWVMWNGYIDVPLEIIQQGSHTISVSASKVNFPERNALLGINIEGTSPFGTKGETLIKQQLQFFHQHLLGENLALDSSEITASYQLLLDIRDARIAAGFPAAAIDWGTETCAIPIEDWWAQDRSAELVDPAYMQGTWINMLVYFLTDYLYLHE